MSSPRPRAHLCGFGHTPFGRFDGTAPETMIRAAALQAIEGAGLEPKDVDGIVVGHFNAGFLPQDFSGALVALAVPALRHVPAMRVENACATGSAAIWAAIDAVESGRLRRVLVVGFEQMSKVSADEVGRNLLKASFVSEEGDTPGGFAGVFGRIASRYFERYGDQSDALATIASKNHANGMRNPLAHMRRELDFEFCRHASERNPVVAGPLKRSDCSLVSDGAAALLIAREPVAGARQAPLRWRARVQVNDYLPVSRRDPTHFEGAALAWALALDQARCGLDDLGFVEAHDCFTIAELLEYEAMGLAPHGKGAQVALDGATRRDGRLPVNPSGGLKSRGHPIGATGVSQHVMAAMQLTGTAGEMQLASPRLGAVFNMGGVAVANYVSVLEAA